MSGISTFGGILRAQSPNSKQSGKMFKQSNELFSSFCIFVYVGSFISNMGDGDWNRHLYLE